MTAGWHLWTDLVGPAVFLVASLTVAAVVGARGRFRVELLPADRRLRYDEPNRCWVNAEGEPVPPVSSAGRRRTSTPCAGTRP